MQWTALLQLENCIENTKDDIIAKTSDIWSLPIKDRLVLNFILYLFYKYFKLFLIFSEKSAVNALHH